MTGVKSFRAELGEARTCCRGETDTVGKMQKRVEYDMHTIRNWSLALDLKIVALKLVRGFVQEEAY